MTKEPTRTPTPIPKATTPQDKFCIDQPADNDWIIETPDSRVSSNFLEQVKVGLASIPEIIRNALHEEGWKIKVAQFLTKANPHLENSCPVDKESAGTTADHRSGVCIPPNIYLAEYLWRAPHHRNLVTSEPIKRSVPKAFNGLKKVQPPVESSLGILASQIDPAIHRTVRHEMGHAFDVLLLHASGESNFMQAYEQDFNKMTDEQRAELIYYIQPDEQGNSTIDGEREAFAEAFATLYGGGCYQTEPFQQAFPNTIRFIENKVNTFKPQDEAFFSAQREILNRILRGD